MISSRETVEIKVILFGSGAFFHCCTHVAAFIRNRATGETLNLEYSSESATLPSGQSLGRVESNCCVGVVSLYSDKSFDDFVIKYKNKFQPKNYHYIKYNCADAVNFALDFFFPEKITPESFFYKTYQMLCCLCCLGTLGLKCFSTPSSCLSTPNDTYKRARNLSGQYGIMSSVFLEEDSSLITSRRY